MLVRAGGRRSLLAGAGVLLAATMLGTAVTVSWSLATGFDRSAKAADLPDVIARFDRERVGEIDAKLRALPNVEATSYRTEITRVRLVRWDRLDAPRRGPGRRARAGAGTRSSRPRRPRGRRRRRRARCRARMAPLRGRHAVVRALRHRPRVGDRREPRQRRVPAGDDGTGLRRGAERPAPRDEHGPRCGPTIPAGSTSRCSRRAPRASASRTCASSRTTASGCCSTRRPGSCWRCSSRSPPSCSARRA